MNNLLLSWICWRIKKNNKKILSWRSKINYLSFRKTQRLKSILWKARLTLKINKLNKAKKILQKLSKDWRNKSMNWDKILKILMIHLEAKNKIFIKLMKLISRPNKRRLWKSRKFYCRNSKKCKNFNIKSLKLVHNMKNWNKLRLN